MTTPTPTPPAPTVRASFTVTADTYVELVELATAQAQKFSPTHPFVLTFGEAELVDVASAPSSRPRQREQHLAFVAPVTVTVPASA